MTESEIMKALECCKKDDCDNCPNDFGNCYSNLANDAISLINRKNAEIERLQEYHDEMEEAIYAFREDHAKVKFFKSEIRAEAIKEFTQRVRKYLLFTKCVNDEDINEIWRYLDQIAKEMGVEL
jgi:hypothetical protein